VQGDAQHRPPCGLVTWLLEFPWVDGSPWGQMTMGGESG
jgi:hypothetical protein